MGSKPPVGVIRIADIAHVRFTAPDLDAMRAFLEDFGLTAEVWEDGCLYARGAGSAPFLHATASGPAAFAGLGLRAQSLEDLDILAAAEGVVVEELRAPGGGKVVRLRDPDGRLVEVVAGQSEVRPAPLRPDADRNTAQARRRERRPVRLEAGPSTVLRLGHAVLNVSDFRTLEAWYKTRFGLITSDEVEIAPGVALGAFLRCDRGAQPVDHHTLFLLQAPSGPGFNHAAFEVANLDDLMLGHTHLERAGRTAAWGVGRHVLGSQIFDYWRDPWGHELEHWTDGDLFTAEDPPAKATLQELLAAQWGPNYPLSTNQAG
jgi:catechol 2,3-dioxygenase-like lactoylglutathione lyase family enzyme